MFAKQLLDTTRGRIVALLRHEPSTAEDLAAQLDLTPNAVRSQLTAMERDGLVRRIGRRRGATRPSQLFEVTSEVEQLLSRAYILLLSELVQVFAETLPPAEVETLLRTTGKALGQQLSAGHRLSRSLDARAALASRLMNEQLGALTRVEHNGQIVIRGAGCPLSALTGKHPGVCLAMESLVSEIVGAPTHECCARDDRPRCCFEIGGASRVNRLRVAQK
jgi:DeoR family transcriptional regulator, suf operon transcriptional repressor